MKDHYVITDLGEVQAWAYTLDVSNNFGGAPTYLINQIYVVPAHRNKGIGKELLTRITNDADLERATIILDFQPEEFGSNRERLAKLYESFDFTWNEKIHGYSREPVT